MKSIEEIKNREKRINKEKINKERYKNNNKSNWSSSLFHTIFLFSFIFFFIFFFGCVQQPQQKIVTEEDAKRFVNDDLNSKYPDAEIKEIIDITPSDNNDSWYIKARVTYNFSSPCPVRMHVYYDYPKKGFIINPPEYVTKDCKVCKEGTCIIGTPEEAIIASHTLAGSETAYSYISTHSDARPIAKFYTDYIDVESGEKYKNVWLIKWYSDKTNYATFVIVSDKGEIVKVWQAIKTEAV